MWGHGRQVCKLCICGKLLCNAIYEPFPLSNLQAILAKLQCTMYITALALGTERELVAGSLQSTSLPPVTGVAGNRFFPWNLGR